MFISNNRASFHLWYLQQSKLNRKISLHGKRPNTELILVRNFFVFSPSRFETAIIKELFSFINFTFITRKRKNKSLTIKLVTSGVTFYFQLEGETKKV